MIEETPDRLAKVLIRFIADGLVRSLKALEDAGALDLGSLWVKDGSALSTDAYLAAMPELEYTASLVRRGFVTYDQREEERLLRARMAILADGFNRSSSALGAAGVIDLRKTRTKYKGIGSEYYDVVTVALEETESAWESELLAAMRHHRVLAG